MYNAINLQCLEALGEPMNPWTTEQIEALSLSFDSSCNPLSFSIRRWSPGVPRHSSASGRGRGGAGLPGEPFGLEK